MERIKDIIEELDQDYALIYPPASEEDIESVNQDLSELGIGDLPAGIAEFFKICGGIEYNGMVIYGTYQNQIVSHNEDRHDYYQEFDHLLFFGAIDDDIYTYNTSTQRYESRDINGMECWDEFDSFEEFFRGEMAQWLNQVRLKTHTKMTKLSNNPIAPFNAEATNIGEVISEISNEYGAELIEKIKESTSTHEEFLSAIVDNELAFYRQDMDSNRTDNIPTRLSRLAVLQHEIERYEEEIICLDNLIKLLNEHEEYGCETTIATLTVRKATAHLSAYAYGDCEECLNMAYTLFKKHKGEESEEVAMVYLNLRDLYFEGERFDDAVTYGEMTLNGLRKSHDADSTEVLEAMRALERAYYKFGAYDQAIEMATKRIELVTNKSGEGSFDLVAVYYDLSQIYKEKCVYRKQAEWLERSIDLELNIALDKSIYGKRDSDLADSLFLLGEAYRLWGEESDSKEILHKAESTLLRAANLYEEYDSQESYSSSKIAMWAMSYLYLSNIRVWLNDLQGALNFAETAEILFKSNRDLVNLMHCYNCYAIIYNNMKSYDKAIEFFDKAVNLLDEDDLNRYILYSNIGTCYQSCYNFEMALDYMIRAYDVTYGLIDDNDFHRATVYSNLGDAYLDVGNYTRSKEYLGEALYIYEKQGEDSIALSSHLSAMGYITILCEEYEKSIEYNLRALDIRLKIDGEMSPLTARSYAYLGRCYAHTNRLEEAQELLFKALDIRKSIHGDRVEPDVAASYFSIGEMLIIKGEYEQASHYLLESIAMFTQCFDDQHPQVARSLHSLGLACLLKGDTARARHYLNAAAVIRNKHYKEDHPDVIATRELLAQC